MINIFIPSKNRLDKPKTYNILKDLGLQPIFVLEPQEENEVKKIGYPYILLDDNNRGITYARNFILKYCREHDIEFAVMIDDDINCFGRILNKKFIKDNTAFLDALNFFKKAKTCGTMEYAQFGWASTKFFSVNKSMEVVHFLYIPAMNGLNYDDNTKEDKDMAIQLIFKGVNIFKINQLCFQCPSIGTNKGGLHDLYEQKKDYNWAFNLQNKWGNKIVQLVTKNNGRIDVKIKWSKIREDVC